MNYEALTSPEYRVLLKDSHDTEMSTVLTDFRENRPELLRRLFGVCSRLRFIDNIRYNIDKRGLIFFPLLWGERNYDDKSFDYQIDRMITYLTLTCIDVIAREENKWLTFDSWFSRELKTKTDDLPEYLFKGIKNLTESNSTEETQKYLKSWVDNDLKANYFNTFGVRQNFTRFIIDNMPVWLEKWIGLNCHIFEGDVNDNAQLPEFYYKDSKEKVSLIAKYFFYLRNSHTHTIDYLEPHEENKIKYFLQPGHEIHEHSINIRKIHKNGDNNQLVVWTIGTTINVTESNIVRLVLISQIRNKILNINDDENFIASFLNRQRYSYLGYNFLNELKLNRITIKDMQLESHIPDDHSAGRKGIQSINYRFGKAFLELHNAMYPHLRNELYPSLIKQDPSFHRNYYPEITELNMQEYLDLVNEYNDKVKGHLESLEKSNSAMGMNDDFSDFLSSHGVCKLCSYIDCIARDLYNRLNQMAY